MKSFIVETDVGQMILTLKYYPEMEKFRLFLHGVIEDKMYDVSFYEDNRTLYIEPDRNAIFDAAKKLINYHFVWTEDSQDKFHSFLWHLWKDTHKELFDSEDRLKVWLL